MRDSYRLPSTGADTGARKSESAHRGKIPRMPGTPGTTKTQAGSVQRQTVSAAPPQRTHHTRINSPDFQSKKYRTVTLIIILMIVICVFGPALIRIVRSMLEAGSSSDGNAWLTGIESIFSDDSDVSHTYEDHNPYEYVSIGVESKNKEFDHIRVGLKFYDEAHTNFDNMCMIDFFTNVYKTYYLTATPARSNDEENKIYQTSFKNVLAIDLFHEDTDPHTHYIAMRYNSRPSPQVISACKNKYGLDRNKYTNYIVTNDNFMYMACIVFDFIFTNILKHPEDKLLVYIGTNNAISVFYQRIIEIFPALKGNVGIFTSIVSDEDKEYALTRKVILSTTKSAGAAMDIPNLKCTLVLAEPFKSAVLAKQTLGRTRAKNTYYIEIVDKGFINCNKYFLQKRNIFQVFAVDCKLVDISDVELYDKGNNIIISGMLDNVRNESWIKPFTVQQQMIKPFTINI